MLLEKLDFSRNNNQNVILVSRIILHKKCNQLSIEEEKVNIKISNNTDWKHFRKEPVHTRHHLNVQ